MMSKIRWAYASSEIECTGIGFPTFSNRIASICLHYLETGLASQRTSDDVSRTI